MLRLDIPKYNYSYSFNESVVGITGDECLKQKILKIQQAIPVYENAYLNLGKSGSLYNLAQNLIPLNFSYLAELGANDLIKLYTNYFAKSGKPARAIYDSLLTAANEKCPYCGGIGRPRNLDHFLAKTHYPYLSVLPLNLVPACRDCNMDGKGDSISLKEEDQIIHPYLDSDIFFSEQWIHANCLFSHTTKCFEIEYFVQQPSNWTLVNKKRVQKHFDDFDLKIRYAKEAAVRIDIYVGQIKNLIRSSSIDLNTAKLIILEPVIKQNPFPNHWERVMCLALMNMLDSNLLKAISQSP
ncbi:HNH endonuclease [Comamonas kerstersii]|uniref:HNH endonuclease n=1 Tax=Comamonas kerstersii TaxID=225992 RepID=A0A6A1R0L0_9BURK|nr:HNH endonuclease [Comamonas kerstersii]KAB0585806.1 HNH endonuclease [Comamonas kerstersii]